MKNISLFDTTLRDGDQAIGYALDIKAKAYIFRLLEKANLNTIEIGMANSACYNDLLNFMGNIDYKTTTEICLLSRLNKSDLQISADILGHFYKYMLKVCLP